MAEAWRTACGWPSTSPGRYGRSCQIRCHCSSASPPRIGRSMDGTWNSPFNSLEMLKPLGVDLIDASSGGHVPGAKNPHRAELPGTFRLCHSETGRYHDRRCWDDHRTCAGKQYPPLRRRRPDLSGQTDCCTIRTGRLHAAQELEQEARWPIQYGYAVRRLFATVK